MMSQTEGAALPSEDEIVAAVAATGGRATDDQLCAAIAPGGHHTAACRRAVILAVDRGVLAINEDWTVGFAAGSRTIARKTWSAPEQPDARAGLLAAEWSGNPRDPDNPSCPCCRQFRHTGHAPDCPVGAGLGRLPMLPGVVRQTRSVPGHNGFEVLRQIPVTDALEALARRALCAAGENPEAAVADPTCEPGSPAAAVDRVPAWWAWLSARAEDGSLGPDGLTALAA
jgi:hypothetical protein